MTRDEVMALSDDLLQIRVAGLLGATDIDRGARTGALMAYWPEDDEGHGKGWKPIEDYPNDIAAAWELIEQSVECEVYYPGADAKDDIWARMTLVDRINGPCSGKCPGDLSAARAITRAFIIAKEVKIDA